MKYAKLIGNEIEFAPQNKGAIINYNTNVELMIADGYKLFVETKRPVTNRMYHIGYNETSNQIQEVIVYDETQEEADEREKREEEERVANLTMTALDFVGVLKVFGLTSQQIRTYLDEHIELDEQLKYCQNVYCGVVQALCPLVVYGKVITKEMVINAFKYKNNEIEVA